MKKININQLVQATLTLKEENNGATLLGIGPMSESLIRASFELAQKEDFPLMFIASRNQVDADEFGAGYVNGWDQKRFATDIKRIASEIGFDGLYYLCRDHGGPWQRDEERNAHLDEQLAMEKGIKSYEYDIKNGFNLLMIDPTKDPFQIGKVLPLNLVIDRTVFLIERCEEIRLKLGLPEIGYEVGTEETNGGLTSTETYEDFIQKLFKKLDEKKLPRPIFIVGQTGTLVRNGEQVGEFNFENAKNLSDMAAKYHVGIKEHNGDYLTYPQLLKHLPAGITATNVAPEFGTVETDALLELIKLEKFSQSQNLIGEISNLERVMKEEAIRSRRWEKWVSDEEKKLKTEEIILNEELSNRILEMAGHYTFNEEIVKIQRGVLMNNLQKMDVDGERFIIERLKESLHRYVAGFNLSAMTTRVCNM